MNKIFLALKILGFLALLIVTFLALMVGFVLYHTRDIEIAEVRIDDFYSIQVVVYDDLDAPLLHSRIVLRRGNKKIGEIANGPYPQNATRIDGHIHVERTESGDFHVFTSDISPNIDLIVDVEAGKFWSIEE